MSDYFDRVERQIVRNVEAGLPRSRRMTAALGHLGYVAAVAIVILVVGVFLLAGGAGSSRPAAPAASRGVNVSLTPPGPVSGATASRTLAILRARLHQAVPGAHVSWAGGRIVVHAPNGKAATRAQILALAAPGRLAFYDWEADVITPNGKTVASQLQAQNPTALTISQGSGTAAPGSPGAGCLSLHAALALAAKQPKSARAILVQAAPPDSTGDYYVLRDAPALSGRDITDPQQSTDPNTKAPDVTFGFTAAGAKAFHTLTATVARRGQRVSSPGQQLNQHFAIALDNRLIEVPYVDFRQYPDGVSAANGAELTGGLTRQETKDIATLLRYGPLPVNLTAAG